jgi:hypothetical protein
MTRIKIASVALLLVLAGCGSLQSSNQYQEELKLKFQSASKDNRECYLRNVSKADDGISDASTVALALAGLCANEFQKLVEAQVAAMDNENQRLMLRQQVSTNSFKISMYLPGVMSYRNWLKTNK